MIIRIRRTDERLFTQSILGYTDETGGVSRIFFFFWVGEGSDHIKKKLIISVRFLKISEISG